MKIAIAHVKSVTPYSQSKNIDKEEHPEKPKETKDAYEGRMWRERIHANADGFIEIPPTAFTSAVAQAARRLQLQIPGKGKTQYTKYFEAGVQAVEPLTLKCRKDDIASDRLFVPSDGIAGSGKRVWKRFPRIDSWSGAVTFYIFDDIIPQDIFVKVLQSAGQLVGIGRFRPEKRGFYGRFAVEKVEWLEEGMAEAAE